MPRASPVLLFRQILQWDRVPARVGTRFPSWAERERGSDPAWISETPHVFWPVVQQGYEEHGRGPIVLDSTQRPTGGGHPSGHLLQAMVDGTGNAATQRMVREYDPTWELVAVLLNARDRTSTYRMGVAPRNPR